MHLDARGANVSSNVAAGNEKRSTFFANFSAPLNNVSANQTHTHTSTRQTFCESGRSRVFIVRDVSNFSIEKITYYADVIESAVRYSTLPRDEG